jgi:hypothetical protein
VSIFVLQIKGVAIIAFNADDLIQAEQAAADARLRADLMVNETKAGPIWNGSDDIVVREAMPSERSKWEFTRSFAVPDKTDEELGRLEIWLVNITNRADDDARRRPLH